MVGRHDVQPAFTHAQHIPALATCLAGEIPFDRFTVHPDASAKQPDWRLQFIMFNDPSSKKAATTIHNVCLSSSGLGFDARGRSLWGGFIGMPQVSEARYLVEVQLSPQDNDPAVPAKSLPAEPPLLVLPDLERITEPSFIQAQRDYVTAFRALENLLKRGVKDGPSMPFWSRLEQADSDTLSGFSWDIRKRAGTKTFETTFQFDPGAWLLTLTDQARGILDASPRGVLTSAPVLAIKPDKADPQTLVVLVTSPSTNTPDAAAAAGTLTYTLAAGKDSTFGEQITITDLVTVYDMFEAARILRSIAGLDPPDLDPVARAGARSQLSDVNPGFRNLKRKSRSTGPLRA